MKYNWHKLKLGDILERTESVNPLQSPNTEFDYIDVSSISNRTFRIIETKRLKGKEAPSRARRLVKTNDVLFATVRPTLQRIAIVPDELNEQICSTGYFVLRPKPGIDHRFIFYFLLTDNFMNSMGKLQKGASYPAVTDSEIRSQLIELPPLPEQQRIVSILDEAFAGIAKAKANTEKNLQNARAIFESHLQFVFTRRGEGWLIQSIGDMCNLMTGGTPQKSNNEYFENGEVKWLVSGDINIKEIFDCEGRITEKGMSNSNAKYLPVNSVMIALNGQGKTRGTVAMLRTTATCNQSLVSIYPKDPNTLLPDYIYHNLYSRYSEIRKITGDSGNDRRGLNMDLIRKIKIAYPQSLDDQKQIVSNCHALHIEIKRLESIYAQKLTALDELKKSLLHKAFNGEL